MVAARSRSAALLTALAAAPPRPLHYSRRRIAAVVTIAKSSPGPARTAATTEPDTPAPLFTLFLLLQKSMKQSPLSTVCRAICRAALAVIASACVMTANAQTISTVLLPADREVYSKQSTSATLFNGEPFIAYKRCATSGCGVVQEIAITYCVSNCGTANPVWRDRVISNAPSSVFGEYVAAAIARDGNPMITWVDVSFAGASPSTVMVARCIAECDSERPRYVSHPVATLASGSLDRIALIDAGASGSGQTVAFIQTAEGQRRLRVATCVTGCASASATYNIATVDNQTGRTTENRISMTAYAGKPIIAYTDFGNDV